MRWRWWWWGGLVGQTGGGGGSMAYLKVVRLLTFHACQGRLRARSLVVGASFEIDEPCAVGGGAFAGLGRGAKEARKAYSMPRSASADPISHQAQGDADGWFHRPSQGDGKRWQPHLISIIHPEAWQTHLYISSTSSFRPFHLHHDACIFTSPVIGASQLAGLSGCRP